MDATAGSLRPLLKPASIRTTALAAVLAAVAIPLLAACNSDSGGTSAVGVDYPRSDTDFWNSYIKYTPQFAKQLKMTLKTTNSQNDVTAPRTAGWPA